MNAAVATAAPAGQGPDASTQDERRAAWLADRRTCITGTEIAAILGMSKFMRPIDVYLEKMGPRTVEQNTAMHAGKRFERAILEEYAETHGCEIIFADPFRLYKIPDFELLGATLDAIRVDDGRPVDAKNIRYKDEEWGEEGTDDFPLYYRLQLHVQAMAKQKDIADLAVCFTGQDFVTYTYHRDPEVDDLIKTEVTAWWQKHILGGVVPEPDGSESYSEFLKRRFARNTDVLIEPDDAMRDLVSALHARKGELSTAEAAKDQIEQQIKALIGDAGGIRGLCTWKNNKDSVKVDWKSVVDELRTEVDAELLNGLIKIYTEVKPGPRVFRLSK